MQMGWTNSEGNLTNSGKWGVGGITSGMIMAGDLYSGYITGKANKAVNKAYADIADIQAQAAIVEANKENLYRNEEMALQGWGAARELRALKGSQKVAQAASGTYGPGDDRLAQDAEAKAYRQTRDMLRALQLESFERSNRAKIASIGYAGKAKQYRIAAKNSVKAGMISGLAQGFNDTTRYLATASTFWKKTDDEWSYKPTKSDVKSALSKNKSPNKLNLYTFGKFK